MLNQISASDMRALAVFKCVAAYGSYDAAQEKLNISISTISSQISGLEGRIGFKLCQRGRGGFKLTERGTLVLQEFKKLEAANNMFRQFINSIQNTAAGVLRVGLLDHIVTENNFSMAAVIQRFTEVAPDVHLELVQDIQSHLHNFIIEDKIDLAIGAFDARNQTLKSKRLYCESQQIYCGSGHPFFNMKDSKISHRALEKANWINRGYQLNNLPSPPFSMIKSTMTAASFESILIILLAGRHLGYLPRHFAYEYEEKGLLKAIKPDTLSSSVNISIISRAGRRDTLAMKVFKEICEEVSNSSGPGCVP